MTSTLSCLSYARVLIEVDLREDTPHFVAVSLPSIDSQDFVTFVMPLAILDFFVPKLHPVSKMGVALRLTKQVKGASLIDWVPTYSNMSRPHQSIRKNRVSHYQFRFL
jgi:hypothetical protein